MPSSQEIDGPAGADMHGTKTSLPAAEKKHGGSNMIGKLFGKKSESNLKPVELETLEEEIEGLVDPKTFFGGITPCPYIRPLEHRLQPRIEPIRSRRPPSDASSDAVVSPITRARNRGETNAILSGRISDEDLQHAGEETDANGAPLVPVDSHAESFYISNLQQIDYVAVMLSHHPDGVGEWRYFLECYTKGNFNLSRPPNPPECSGSFQYLHAVYPPNETERMALCSRYDILWPQFHNKNVGKVLLAAMSRFSTPFTSVSIFDQKNEVFKVENGYNRSHIDRDASIAAHVLYSSDVMVVLDTKKDWRFENNPLVKNRPKIRFFAGAPLLSDDGEVMGVLAIFGKEPRTSFSQLQRRELADYSATIMGDLNYQTNCLSDPELRSTPLLQRDSAIFGDYQPRNIKSPVMDFSANNVEPSLIPPPLKYYKVAKYSDKETNLYLNRRSQTGFAHHAEPTPPASAESNHGGFFDKSENFGKNQEQLSEDPILNDISSLGLQEISDSRRLGISTPRPFSASDITSLNLHPPNTPDRSVKDEDLSHQPKFDLTVEDFMSLSDTDCLEDSRDEQLDGADLRNGVSSGQHEETTRREPLDRTQFDIPTTETTHTAPKEHHKPPSTPVKDSLAGNAIPSTASSPLIDLSTPPREADDSMALVPYTPSPSNSPNGRTSSSSNKSSQSDRVRSNKRDAAYACQFFAQQFDYDLIYCVELKPSLSFMTDQELFADNGLSKWFLTAYGLALPLDLSSEIHIRALRSREGVYWHNPQDHYEDGEYATGYMVPVYSEGSASRALRNSGIVLGAFRKPRRNEKGELMYGEDDRHRLMEFGKVLGSILLKKPLPVRPTAQRSNTQPTPSTSYPANEASEVKFGDTRTRAPNHSFSARYAGSYPANGAVGSTLGDMRTRDHYSNVGQVGGYPRNATPTRREKTARH